MGQTGDRLRGHKIALLTSIPNPSCSGGSSVMLLCPAPCAHHTPPQIPATLKVLNKQDLYPWPRNASKSTCLLGLDVKCGAVLAA
ncbi:Alpha-agarase [Dissostichus eleginoides]|uniref:Alpha-agarase n=1 Tax=Dissostichus eleginoides TaxID=100907 RepID=A0AAD9BST0_DISEL|nr:Alpha-agarase [Dissostichus eleginoides]